MATAPGHGQARPLAVEPGSPKRPSSGALARLFAATEEENRRAILRALPKAVGGRLLDIGTHRGDFALRVAKRTAAREVHGVELIERHAIVARSHGIRVECADVEEGLPFPDRRFDVVHCNQLIEHLRDTDGLVSEVQRVLKPTGIAVLSTNNLSSWHNIVSLFLGLQPFPMHVSDRAIVGNRFNPEHGEPHEDAGRIHVRLFTGRALAELGALHGLFPVRVRTSGYYPLPPMLARMATRLDPLHGAFLIATFRRAK